MTISRAAFAALAEFVASLPEYVPGPEITDYPFARWKDGDFHISLDPGSGGEQYCRQRLIEHYRPKPREYVLYGIPREVEERRSGGVTLWDGDQVSGDGWKRFKLVEILEDA